MSGNGLYRFIARLSFSLSPVYCSGVFLFGLVLYGVLRLPSVACAVCLTLAEVAVTHGARCRLLGPLGKAAADVSVDAFCTVTRP